MGYKRQVERFHLTHPYVSHLTMDQLYEEQSTHLEPLWTVEQAADYFHLNPMTIYRWVSKGRIKSTKIGNRVRIPRSEIERIAGETQANLQP